MPSRINVGPKPTRKLIKKFHILYVFSTLTGVSKHAESHRNFLPGIASI